ncbi:MAG: AgmX/PglI C-terminal domain-containing protein [Sandaracinaceae bacterium]
MLRRLLVLLSLHAVALVPQTVCAQRVMVLGQMPSSVAERTRQQIRIHTVLREGRASLRACVRDARRTLLGRQMATSRLEVTVGADSTAERVTVVELGGHSNEAVEQCLVEYLRTFGFPPDVRGVQFRVTYLDWDLGLLSYETSRAPGEAAPRRDRGSRRTPRRPEPEAGRMTWRVASTQGPLDASAIERTVRPHEDSLQRCFERERGEYPALSGSVRIRLEIGADGYVTRARVERASSDVTRAIARCLGFRLSRYEFASTSSGESSRASLSFVFSAR